MQDERLTALLDAIRRLHHAVTDLETGILMAVEQQRKYDLDPVETKIQIIEHAKEFVPLARKMATGISNARREYAKRRRVIE